ncbi:MAG: cell division protein ZapB [Marinomonas sp.]|uniref:cell division protein ZapB n=1 Tax=Marinomonas sp. GJ51-6 TaxID=2992802 RepID=UPI0029349921|nr:cell division protein ZapB [Marinomonas sp. GJ51-6]WOD08430.1 cell division protein ZapB [Marinomonas sp. GJ51-6]
MNNELLQHLEQRINAAVDEISSLRTKISELEMQNYELNEEKNELQNTLTQTKEQQSSWESSLSQMLNRLNQIDNG